MSGMRLRQSGQRQSPAVRSRGAKGLIANSLGVAQDGNAEHRLNLNQVWALEHVFEGNCSVKAARTILAGQLLSGGISLRKDGNEVELTSAFKDHLREHWLPFAGRVLDSFLKWGLCVVSYEDADDEIHRLQLLAKRRRVQEPSSNGKSRATRAAEEPLAEAALVVPIVPALGTYEVAFRNGGRRGYKRKYLVYATAPSTATEVDEEARVFVRQDPDNNGNLNSPLASVFESASFVNALMELAMVAESSRARPRLVTQPVKKSTAALDPSNLFFDSESRAVQDGAAADENATAVRSLQLQQQMCSMINKLQTRTPAHDDHSFGGTSYSSGKQIYAPPEVQPTLFTVPRDQEIAPNVSNPESRGDLEALSRMTNEQMAAALGVPADLMFSGRLSLLNTTVNQLATAVNSVLTVAYRDIYAKSHSDDVGNLQLLTSPLSSTEEVLNLYAGGLVPLEVAMPSVMHSIGATKTEIDAALEKVQGEVDKRKAEEQEAKNATSADNHVNLQLRKAEFDEKRVNTHAASSKPESGSKESTGV